jgi:cytochrome d ubiquinol oxidase subunit II
MITLQVIWFVLIVVLFVGYVVLDGFDLGVGFWHFFAKNEETKMTHYNAISPFWDGNEVWLLTAGGAMFAAFPPVYATVFSGFYTAMIMLLFGLILRATAIEFRHQIQDQRWKKVWDIAFAVGSTLPPILLGVAAANLLIGLPINEKGDYMGGLLPLLNPFAIFMGVLVLIALAAHGALFLTLKSEGQILAIAWRRARVFWYVALGLLVAVVIWALATIEGLAANYMNMPALLLLPLLLAVSIVFLVLNLMKEKDGMSFLFSSLTIGLTGFVLAFSRFPNFVFATNDSTRSLTLFNSSSSEKTLFIMLIIALIGVPIVIGYTIFIFRVFRGKVSTKEPLY